MGPKDLSIQVSLKDTQAFKEMNNFMVEILTDKRIDESIRNEYIDKFGKILDEKSENVITVKTPEVAPDVIEKNVIEKIEKTIRCNMQHS